MNYRTTAYTTGIIMLVEAALMSVPFFIAICLSENTVFAFGITLAALIALGIPLVIKKPKELWINPKEGFITVALGWLIMSLFGAVPFIVSGAIPNFIDAFFEAVSGFTTTGATVIGDIQALPKSILFWRAFTQWIGGMGVLVFVIAVLPKSDTKFFHMFRAESPGPQVGKLVSKLKHTALILYGIYVAMTILQIILLSIKMPFFESILHALATASTGGFSNMNLSVAAFDSKYIDTVITVFMILFSINFNIFFLILLGKFKDVVKSEELKVFLTIIIVAIGAITASLLINRVYQSFGEALRFSAFQAASMVSTTGFVAADYTKWPTAAQFLLLLLMFIGGSAGSTAGGLKVSRVIILFKSGVREIKNTRSPRSVNTIRLDGKPLDYIVTHGTMRYFVLYLLILCGSVLLVSLSNPGFGGESMLADLTAAVSCLNNVGPYFGALGTAGNFSSYSAFSKLVFGLDMLFGRLEIFPMLLLFYPKTWKM